MKTNRRAASATVPAPARTVRECLQDLQFSHEETPADHGLTYSWGPVSRSRRTETLPLTYRAPEGL